METIRLQGRTLTGDDPAGRNGTGRLKDMASRTLLTELHVRGLIDLPCHPFQLHAYCSEQETASGGALFSD